MTAFYTHGAHDLSGPRVSVIMNCLNSAKYLREAIDSVYAQTYSGWEIIFWDNCSTDDSAAIANSYDSRLRYFRGERTVPLGEARNLAIKNAGGEFIAFLDCDDIWMPGKLEKQIRLFDSNLKVGLVYSDTLFLTQATGKSTVLYGRKKQPSGMAFRNLLSNYFLSMETVVIRKKALEGLDEWFDPRFHMVEEADLFLRIARNWEMDYVPEPLAKWRLHSESWSWTKRELFGDENLMMLEKFKQLYPGFDSEFRREIGVVQAKAAYHQAVYKWKNGNATGARELMARHLMNLPPLAAVYIFTFFPYAVFAFLLRLAGKHA